MTKRQRTDTPSWWKTLVTEIISHGGFVHPNLEFSLTDRRLITNTMIENDQVVLHIPRVNLVCLENEKDRTPWLKEMQTTIDPDKFYFPWTDALTAWLLSTNTKENQMYLETLPNPSAWDALPRRWSKDDICKYLTGSPLLIRVLKSKEGVASDYRLLCQAFKGEEKPSLETFSTMLCAVTSRAFDDSNGKIVMVPILDLCNHARGKKEKKNLTYTTLQDGSIMVKASQKIEANEDLRLTYGAQSNSQLFLNYGFTIPNNIEPDGSSNDFFEFNSGITLRTGPKSYSYGGFVKALEEMTRGNNNNADLMFEDEMEDDMEAFLNECDPSDQVDIYKEVQHDDEDDEKEAIQEQVTAVQQLRQRLLKKLEEYHCKGTIMKEQLESNNDSLVHYSALLIQSEQRCLYFFYRVTLKVESLLLEKELADSNEFQVPNLEEEDVALMEVQTTELAKAYMMIRNCDLY